VLPLPYQWQLRVERLKRMFGGFFGGGDSERRPQLCPACGVLVGVNATRCHECGANLRFGLAAWSKGLSEFFGGHAPVSTAILIANVLMFCATLVGTMKAGGGGGLSILWGMDDATLYRLGASEGRSIFAMHEWYRLITAMFLHGGLLHIGFNMMVFLDLGPIVEELYGSARYLFFYVLMGATSFLVSAFTGHFSLGASGAILGLVGLLIAFTSKRGGSQMKQMRSRLISWVVTIFLIGFMFQSLRTDNAAHFGGLAAGFLLGKLSADRQPLPGSERTRAYLLGWLAGIVVIASFVMMALHYNDPLPTWMFRVQ
jgi:rhomboid protease GluP